VSFADLPLKPRNKKITGLALSQPGLLPLELAAGSVLDYRAGATYTLAAPASHTFTADATLTKKVFMALVDNGTTTDLWVDEYLDDGFTRRADVPAGYTRVIDVAWFDLPANETDLANVTINRRTWE
jgi:hypothetical protein